MRQAIYATLCFLLGFNQATAADTINFNKVVYGNILGNSQYDQQYLTLEYYGYLFTCSLSPERKDLDIVVVFEHDEKIKSDIFRLNWSCPFDGPGPRSWASIPLFTNSALSEAYQLTRAAGENFTFEVAVVDEFGNWDSDHGQNYQLSVFLNESSSDD
ncbi:MAG: hypothetical protein HRU19_27360 [Pseudobacteriovorax sp.]|nr:hypothetical protein [Pseudobacteriovorax sp.]